MLIIFIIVVVIARFSCDRFVDKVCLLFLNVTECLLNIRDVFLVFVITDDMLAIFTKDVIGGVDFILVVATETLVTGPVLVKVYILITIITVVAAAIISSSGLLGRFRSLSTLESLKHVFSSVILLGWSARAESRAKCERSVLGSQRSDWLLSGIRGRHWNSRVRVGNAALDPVLELSEQVLFLCRRS